MATPRERLEELRELKRQKLSQPVETDRQKLERLRELKRQKTAQIDAGGLVDSILEPAAAISSGIPATIASGLVGAAQALNPFAEEGAGERAVQGTQEALTFSPKTEAGRQSLNAIQDLIKNGMDIAAIPSSIFVGIAEGLTGGNAADVVISATEAQQEGIPKLIAEEVFETTGSPLAATAVEALPAAAEAVFGAKGLKADSSIEPTPAARSISTGEQVKLSQLDKFFTTNTQTGIEQKQALKIVNKSTDAELAPFKVDSKGNLVEDKIGKEAIRQGFEPGDVQSFKMGSRLDKIQMRKMLNRFKANRKNSANKSRNRPADIVGQSLQKRLQFLTKQNNLASTELKTVAESLEGQPIDISDAVNTFGNRLEEFGITLVPDGKNGFKPDFTDSELAPGDRGPVKEVIRQMSRLSRSGNPDALTAHKFKRIIDRNVEFGKSKGNIGDDPARALKEFRRDIDKALDDTYPQYDAVNTKFRETKMALDGVKDLAGSKNDTLGAQGDRLLGNLARRITSNAMSSGRVTEAFDEVDRIVLKYGGKVQDDIVKQLDFANMLNKRFGSQSETSLQSELGKETVRAATGDQTIIGAAGRLAESGANKVFGKNDEKAIKALERLLSQ